MIKDLSKYEANFIKNNYPIRSGIIRITIACILFVMIFIGIIVFGKSENIIPIVIGSVSSLVLGVICVLSIWHEIKPNWIKRKTCVMVYEDEYSGTVLFFVEQDKISRWKSLVREAISNVDFLCLVNSINSKNEEYIVKNWAVPPCEVFVIDSKDVKWISKDGNIMKAAGLAFINKAFISFSPDIERMSSLIIHEVMHIALLRSNPKITEKESHEIMGNAGIK